MEPLPDSISPLTPGILAQLGMTNEDPYLYQEKTQRQDMAGKVPDNEGASNNRDVRKDWSKGIPASSPTRSTDDKRAPKVARGSSPGSNARNERQQTRQQEHRVPYLTKKKAADLAKVVKLAERLVCGCKNRLGQNGLGSMFEAPC